MAEFFRLTRGSNARQSRQGLLPFLDQSLKRQRSFKRLILLVTLFLVLGMIGGSHSGRYHLLLGMTQTRDALTRRFFGLEPDRQQVEAEWQIRRERGIEQTRKVLTNFYKGTTEEMRELFRVVGMDPEHGLIRYGRADQGFLISSQVFELDEHGRSYRFRPKTRSVWLRQVTLRNGPFGMFQILDTPQHRAAAARAHAIVDEGSIQNTNSWGLRGEEPNPSAKVRGIALSESFIQAMFNRDDATPPVYLERVLTTEWKVPVSILNTGHIGYSPEQYYYTLREYGERFRPHFVVVSVCPNDFGDGMAVMSGHGDWFEEAGYWLDQIRQWCWSRSVSCLVVPIPTHFQVETVRRDDIYPGRICDIYRIFSGGYCDPLNEFVDEHLRLMKLAKHEGRMAQRSLLYNRHIDDDHFSPQGATLWAKIVGRRLKLILDPASVGVFTDYH